MVSIVTKGVTLSTQTIDRFSVSCPPDLREATQAEADRRGISRSALVRELLLRELGLTPDPIYKRRVER